ncbi:RING-H2 finger protein 2B [Arabidopsis thaliana]|jgi:E3 ubiquitin-protein ligase RHA2|uniref:RING-H2 finger protein 2B n=2 Tax=Arabidopsis thaliana TaxID=3702 RepID=A0A1P8B063_ARATH|nr:RING-H2 finger protein 2B [Arabidopsis thaliana]ANM62281.1 RING-H2 finger protein 2B [Arabidopsis thaliana]|eukprot:NP_001324450.1 RING-H2 finger protein 2B [Arabidopsis thaliana]
MGPTTRGLCHFFFFSIHIKKKKEMRCKVVYAARTTTRTKVTKTISKTISMGLQGQLSDVSSDSIPLMLLALLATFFRHVRSLLLFPSSAPVVVVTSNLSVLADQLNLNRLFSYRYSDNAASDCIVCLSKLKTGEEVRKLDCRHVFHKQCLEGWLQHLNFNCPLCRSPLLPHHHQGHGSDASISAFPLRSTSTASSH